MSEKDVSDNPAYLTIILAVSNRKITQSPTGFGGPHSNADVDPRLKTHEKAYSIFVAKNCCLISSFALILKNIRYYR